MNESSPTVLTFSTWFAWDLLRTVQLLTTVITKTNGMSEDQVDDQGQEVACCLLEGVGHAVENNLSPGK